MEEGSGAQVTAGRMSCFWVNHIASLQCAHMYPNQGVSELAGGESSPASKAV